MMTNLFSIFDPSNNQFISMSWLASLIFVLLIQPSIWLIKSKKMNFIKTMVGYLNQEFKTILGEKNSINVLIVVSIFMTILYHNFMGLLPYIFNGTSHMSITLSLALPLWLGMNIYGWINNMKSMFAHLLPQSTPGALMPFMVLIETTSNLIRPMTLAIRLTANMIAGHLLMTLLGNQLTVSTLTNIMPMMIVQILLTSLEFAVALIQAYVFSVLMTLYINEIPSQ